MGGFKKWGDPSNGAMILKWGIDTPLWTMRKHNKQKSKHNECQWS